MYPPGRKQSRGRLADLMVPLESGNYPSTLAYPADIPLAYPVDILHMRNEQVSVSRFPIAYHLGDAIACLRPRMLVRAV